MDNETGNVPLCSISRETHGWGRGVRFAGRKVGKGVYRLGGGKHYPPSALASGGAVGQEGEPSAGTVVSRRRVYSGRASGDGLGDNSLGAGCCCCSSGQGVGRASAR